jgi:DNA-binding CsgD family transcriptional regulator
MKNTIEISTNERTCLEYLRQEKTQKEIAELMFLSETKVERVFKELRERFGCKNNYGLLAFAYENHLLNRTKEVLQHSQQ